MAVTGRTCALCCAHEAYEPKTGPNVATACELCTARFLGPGPESPQRQPRIDVDEAIEQIEWSYLEAFAEAAHDQLGEVLGIGGGE